MRWRTRRWRGLPKRMSRGVADKTVERIAEHAERHGLDERRRHPARRRAAARRSAVACQSGRTRSTLAVPAQVNVALQTNGTLLDRPMLDTLRRLGVQVGVSLDGDAEATGRHRRYANGRNSFDAVADGLDLLQSPEFRDCYSGILCTIDSAERPGAHVRGAAEVRPPALDLLLPHANWSCPPPAPATRDWLISVFERWYAAPRQETRIRLFSELIQLVLGQPGAVEGLGLLPSTLVVVDTDGSIKQLDSLSSAYPGAADTGLHVMSRQLRRRARPPDDGGQADRRRRACTAVPGLPGDGDLRRRPVPAPVPATVTGFRNPSVYCEDLLKLITHVRDRVSRTCAPAHAALQVVRLDLRGQPGPLLRGPRLGVLQGERLLVPAQYVGEAPLAGRPGLPRPPRRLARLAAAISVSG